MNVVVVIGIGGMGEAIARRQGTGHITVLADFNDDAAQTLADAMHEDGFEVVAQKVDVSSRDSVEEFVRIAKRMGPVTQVVHTAGLSPAQASIEAVLRVDLVGVGRSHARDGFQLWDRPYRHDQRHRRRCELLARAAVDADHRNRSAHRRRNRLGLQR